MDTLADTKRRRNLDKHPGIHRLNEIAGMYPGGDLHVQKAISLKTGRWLIVWEIDFNCESFFIFNNSGCIRDTLDEAIAAELEQLEERLTMNIFGTALFPYLEGIMIKDSGMIAMTVTDVTTEEVGSNRGTEMKQVLHFRERDKGLILNKTNAKTIAMLYGPETEDWRNQRIYLYAEAGTWFGKSGYAVRIGDQIPANGRNDKPAPEDTGPDWGDLKGQEKAEPLIDEFAHGLGEEPDEQVDGNGNNTDWRSKLQKGRQSLSTVCSIAANGIPTVNSDDHALAILEKHYDIPEQYTDTWKWEMSQGVTQEFAVKMYDFIDEHERQKVDD